MNNSRINKLTEILKQLNRGGVTDELRKDALDLVSNIDPLELSIAEQNLIDNGMNPQDLRSLCDIHMDVLKDELYKVKSRIEKGHVIDTLINEHEIIKGFLIELDKINFTIQKMKDYNENPELISNLAALADKMLDAENHHRREENVLFPEMEKRGITGPTRIMRMEHEELRARKRLLKETAYNASTMDFEDLKFKVDEAAKYIVFNFRDHIYKENHILYPTALDIIQDKELWNGMKKRCDQIGYCSFTPKF